MKRNQTAHEMLIPMLVEAIGAKTYLELGTHKNETIGKVRCMTRIGVDLEPVQMDRVKHYRMSTDTFIEHYAENHAPYDVVFIDADHSFRSVKKDFNGIYPYVAHEGLILLHDTNPEKPADTQSGFCGDAWKFARMLYVDHEAVTLPYHPGLTIVRKRVTWGPK